MEILSGDDAGRQSRTSWWIRCTKGVVDIVWTAAAYTGAFSPYRTLLLPWCTAGSGSHQSGIMELMQTELKQVFPASHPLLVHVQGHVFICRAGQLPVWRVSRVDAAPARHGNRQLDYRGSGRGNHEKRHPKLPKAMAQGDLDGALMSFIWRNPWE